jgi:hypothetical protein
MKKRDNLVSKVVRFNLPKDEFGEYVPFCSFSYHPGLVLRKYVCEQRNCKHYRKMYVDGKGQLDDPTGENCGNNN